MIDQRLRSKQWRISHLYRIVDKSAKLITYRRNSIQQFLAEDPHPRKIILKARQQGITTEICIDYLDDVLFHNNLTAVIIAHDREAVTKIFKKVKLAWDNFPLKEAMGYVANTDSANELSFNNGSSIRVALSSRADTVHRLHISEFGKICKKYPQKAEEIITGAIPSVPSTGRITIESTAEGEFGSFYSMYWEAVKTPPQTPKQFKAFFFPWTLNEEYKLSGNFEIPEDLKKYQEQHQLSTEQINWYFIEKQTQKDKMRQEYPTTDEEAFIGSGNKLFDPDKVAKLKEEEGNKQGDWIFYDVYKPSHRYAIGADVAEGVGQDSSTAVVIDFTPLKPKVVAEYASNTIAPDIFAHELANVGNRFGNCLIAPERNNHGWATITKLKDIYFNIYKSQSHEKEIAFIPTQTPEKLGWHTNGATKPKMLFDLNEAINEELIEITSRGIKEELRTYDKEDLSQVRFDEKQTKHWDRVIALAIAWQMKTEVSNEWKSEPLIIQPISYK